VKPAPADPQPLSTLSTATLEWRHSCVTGSLDNCGMNNSANDAAIDEIVASCNGDLRGALKALMLVNEQLEAEIQQLYATVGNARSHRGRNALH
jgi:replication-associated recombination protein RarA